MRARRRLGRDLGILLGALLAAALWAPDADRDVLVARGVTALLGAPEDAAAPAPAAPPWRRAIRELAADGRLASAAARLRIDGVARRSPPIEREVGAHWNRLRASGAVEAPPLRFGEASGARADLVLHLDVGTADGVVRVRGRARRGDAQREFAATGAWTLPGRTSLLPPLVAIAAGLALGRALLALFLGVWAGAVLRAWPEAGLAAPLRGLVDVFGTLLLRELRDGFRLEIVGFIVALVALVGVVSRAGGLQGLVDRLVRHARTPRRAQLATAGLGLLLFFDDYANCVLVGSTMRPLTDRLRISREKLAWIVDSTAAPVASLALLSTWIAFQVSLFEPQLAAAGLAIGGYAMFLATLPFRFYCGLTLLSVFSALVSGRDVGPMARAERRARTTGALVRPGGRAPAGEAPHRLAPEPGMPPDWRVAAGPLALTIAVTFAALFAEGGGLARLAREPASLLALPGLSEVLVPGSGAGPIFAGSLAGLWLALFLGAGNAMRLALATGAALALAGRVALPTAPLTWVALFAAGAGLGAGLGTAVRTRRPFVPAPRLLGAAVSSAPTLGFAVALLFLAWMMGAVCAELRTADYLVALLSDALPEGLLPLLLFGVSGLVAFATGSSWSTLSILLPNVVALAASLGGDSPLGATGMVALSIAAVLEGAVFGDHCSPISDTTVLSSVACGCDHLDHVRTQAPLALAVAGAAAACGFLPLAWLPGWGAGAAFGAGALALWGGLWAFGRSAPAPDRPVAPPEFLQ